MIVSPNCHSFKNVLAIVRDGAYAHPGEEEAIERALDGIPRRAEQWLLDAACGIGGTAHYVQSRGWGRVVGFDRDEACIRQARAAYPEVEFQAADVVDVAAIIPRRFDVVYSLSAYHLFTDPSASLRALREAARPGGRLVVFDYSDRGGLRDQPLMVGGLDIIPRAILPAAVEAELAAAGWRLDRLEDLSADFERWYAAFCARVRERRERILEAGGADAFETAREVYSRMLDKIRAGLLGGVLIHADAA